MANFSDRIKGFCAGDDIEVRRTVKNPPAGQTIVQAWLTIKAKLTDTDDEAALKKIITTANLPGVGQIEAPGAESTVLRFELTRTDTLLLTPDSAYFHDVQIKTSADKISTPFKGLTLAARQVTLAE